MNGKNVLILTLYNIKNEPRVYRQIIALKKAGSNIITAGTAPSQFPELPFIQLKHKPASNALGKIKALIHMGLRMYEARYWHKENKENLQLLRKQSYDLIIVHDIILMPIALKLKEKTGIPVIIDAHEHYPSQFEDDPVIRLMFKPLYTYLCNTYLNRCDWLITVCDGIAESYRNEYHVKNVDVITNAPLYEELPIQVSPGDKIRMIHHGAAIPSRKLELMISMFRYLDERFELDIMLLASDQAYYNSLKQEAAAYNGRIRFIDIVPMPEISRKINSYDVGVFLLPPTSFSYNYALPNKFFEFINARLAVAIGPSPEMKKILEKHDLGVVSGDFTDQSFANALNSLTKEKIAAYKQNVDKAAYGLSGTKNEDLFLQIIKNLS